MAAIQNMIFEKITSWFRALYSNDILRDIEKRYEQMSNIELANLLAIGDLRLEAAELARKMLSKRLDLDLGLPPSEIFDIEIERLTILSRKCHICGEENLSQKHEFLMCQEAGIKVNWGHLVSGAALNLATVPIFGAIVAPLGNTSQKYQVISLNLCLCDSCADRIKHVTKDLCTRHPLAEFYMLSGFKDIMWPSELEVC